MEKKRKSRVSSGDRRTRIRGRVTTASQTDKKPSFQDKKEKVWGQEEGPKSNLGKGNSIKRASRSF